MLNTVCNIFGLRCDRLAYTLALCCGYCMLCFLPLHVNGQKDTTQLEGVTIHGSHKLLEEQATFDREKIQTLAPADLGILLKRTTGATVADYGGIGSLKSMSMRGMGSSHTGLVINGLEVCMSQQAQIDFGSISVSNIDQTRVLLQPTGSIQLPVSSQMRGSTVSIETFEHSFGESPIQVRGATTIGSFGRKEIYSGVKTTRNNTYLSFSGNLKSYAGGFSYTLPYSSETLVRQNNALTSYDLAMGAGKKWRFRNTHHRIRAFGKRTHLERELPGAVILYGSSSNEELNTQQDQIGVDYTMLSKLLQARTYASMEKQQLRYYDPDYLNNQGFIDNKYENRSFQSGFNLKLMLGKFHLAFGNDLKSQLLESSRDLGTPNRLNNVAMISSGYDLKYLQVSGGLYHHFVKDENRLLGHTNNYQRWNPQVSIQTSDHLMKRIQLSLWYKHSSRAPSFNELYYAQIGNTNLIPEEAQQFNLGYRWFFNKNRYEFSLTGNTFFNKIKNKIVALPTQNMFIWSIQNVGKVYSMGSEIKLHFKYQINTDLSINSSAGVTYQSVTDRTDAEAPTYEDQIANTPKWTQNSDLQVNWKQFKLSISSIYMGERYALNQNIKSNLLDDYLVLNANISYHFTMAKKHALGIQAGIKNIAHKQYYHINYFVMPGRHYFLRITYEL